MCTKRGSEIYLFIKIFLASYKLCVSFKSYTLPSIVELGKLQYWWASYIPTNLVELLIGNMHQVWKKHAWLSIVELGNIKYSWTNSCGSAATSLAVHCHSAFMLHIEQCWVLNQHCWWSGIKFKDFDYKSRNRISIFFLMVLPKKLAGKAQNTIKTTQNQTNFCM